MEDPRYPIGRFEFPAAISDQDRRAFVAQMNEAPAQVRAAVAGLGPAQLDTPYRDGGWTVRQVVHHLPDSHLNAYVRFRLALTEREPVIKPYEESLWAELPDARTSPVDVSLTLLEALHQRWVLLMRAMEAAQWTRTFRHPERGVMTLESTLALYAWHGRHHTAQINGLRKRMRWE